MKNYQSNERGTFQCEEYADQKVSFEGMLFPGRYGARTVSPTDVDGFIQLDRINAFIFFELKYGNGDVPAGQLSAFIKLVDAIDNKERGNNSVLIVATHQTEARQTIIAKDTRVAAVYWNGKLLRLDPSTQFTLLYSIDRYIKHYEDQYGMNEWG